VNFQYVEQYVGAAGFEPTTSCSQIMLTRFAESSVESAGLVLAR
jgi:hypothetical protein